MKQILLSCTFMLLTVLSVSAKEKKESPLAAKTVKELKAYAEEKGIALDSRAKKADIIATIEAAERK